MLKKCNFLNNWIYVKSKKFFFENQDLLANKDLNFNSLSFVIANIFFILS